MTAVRERMFPIMGLGFRPDDTIKPIRAVGCEVVVVQIPWAMIAPHEAQARSNHGGQSLARLAERGGLGFCEAVAVLENRRWHRMETGAANAALLALVQRYHAEARSLAAPILDDDER